RLFRRAAWFLWITPFWAERSTTWAQAFIASAASATLPCTSLSRKVLIASRMVRSRQRLRARAASFWRTLLRADSEWAMGFLGVKLPEGKYRTGPGAQPGRSAPKFPDASRAEILDEVPAGVIVNQGGRIAYANAEAARILGAPDPQSLLGRDPLELVHPDSRKIVDERLRSIAAG